VISADDRDEVKKKLKVTAATEFSDSIKVVLSLSFFLSLSSENPRRIYEPSHSFAATRWPSRIDENLHREDDDVDDGGGDDGNTNSSLEVSPSEPLVPRRRMERDERTRWNERQRTEKEID